MTLLEQYSQAATDITELFSKCLRKSGPFCIGPTKRGGMFVRWGEKDICTDATVKDLREMRDLLNDFLIVVAGDAK